MLGAGAIGIDPGVEKLMYIRQSVHHTDRDVKLWLFDGDVFWSGSQLNDFATKQIYFPLTSPKLFDELKDWLDNYWLWPIPYHVWSKSC